MLLTNPPPLEPVTPDGEPAEPEINLEELEQLVAMGFQEDDARGANRCKPKAAVFQELSMIRAQWTQPWLPCSRPERVWIPISKLGGDVKRSSRELECTRAP